MSEARVDHLEARLARIEETVSRIDERLAATLPHLATKAELVAVEARLSTLPHLATKAELTDGLSELRVLLADKPSRLYMWGVMAALTGAYTAALAAIGVLLTYLPHH
jgi:hypothetical protein